MPAAKTTPNKSWLQRLGDKVVVVQRLGNLRQNVSVSMKEFDHICALMRLYKDSLCNLRQNVSVSMNEFDHIYMHLCMYVVVVQRLSL